MTLEVSGKNPLQVPRFDEIKAGRKFWGYLDTEALQTRYVLAAHFLRRAKNIIEIGGYRDNVITNYLTGRHESVTVYSLDAEFHPLEADTLNGTPCQVRHVADFFQNNSHCTTEMGLVALGLEIVGEIEPFYDLLRKSQVAIIEIAEKHPPSVNSLSEIFIKVNLRVRCQIKLDLSANEPLLRERLQHTNMNKPFWERILYVLEPDLNL